MSSSNSSKAEPDTGSLQQVVAQAKDHLQGDRVSIGELLDSVQNRGYGPLLLIPSLISISPFGGIPGVSIVTGTVISLISIQMLLWSGHPWIPQKLEEFTIERSRFESGLKKSKPWIKWIDRWLTQRWTVLTTGPMHYVLAVLMILLSLSYYPLALIPLGVFLPGVANTLFALGITARDGLLIVFGLIVTAGAAYSLMVFWPW